MAKRLLEHRTRAIIVDKSLVWPPIFFNNNSIICQSSDDSGVTSTLEVDDLVTDLRESFPDYKRQRQLSVKALVCDILRQRINLDPSATMQVDSTLHAGPDNVVHKSTNLSADSVAINTTLANSYKRENSIKSVEGCTVRGNGGPDSKFVRVQTNDGDVDDLSSFASDFVPETDIPARLCHMGGIESILKDIENLVILPLKYPDLYRHLGVRPTRGILLYGPPGSGKSKLAYSIAGEANCALFRVAATEIVSGMSGESETKLRRLFHQAKLHAPCIIFIDEIDAITPKRDQVSRELEKRIVAQLGLCMDSLEDHFVIVIGATNRQECLDPCIRRNGRFDREISMGIPDARSRSSILETLTRGMQLGLDVNFDEIAAKTPGFVGADLQALIREAAILRISKLAQQGNLNELVTQAGGLDNVHLLHDDFCNAISRVQPSSKREGFATIPDVSWSNIGALADLQKEMEEHIVNPIKFIRLYQKFGLAVPAGILLYGPPGCGKTLLAKAVANASCANFISVKGPELLNKYVGESERAVRLVFARAAASAPCVVFFDEIDSLCPTRSIESNQATERVVNQLLTELDGIEVSETARYALHVQLLGRNDVCIQLEAISLFKLLPTLVMLKFEPIHSYLLLLGGNMLSASSVPDNRRDVYVVAATNRPDIIDSAMLRPGRLEKLLYVPLPNCQGRLDILTRITADIPLDSSVDLEWLADNTTGFSGADLALLTREAGIAAVESITSKLGADFGVKHAGHADFEPPQDAAISMTNFKAALQKTHASVTSQQVKFYEEFKASRL